MTLIRKPSLALMIGAAAIAVSVVADPAIAATHGAAAIEISIVNVSPHMDQAVPASDGEGRLVPVSIVWKTGPWGDRKLTDLTAKLKTTNSDGSHAEVTKALAVKARNDTLSLPLPEGISPISYVLELVGQCHFKGEDGKEQVQPSTAKSSGSF